MRNVRIIKRAEREITATETVAPVESPALTVACRRCSMHAGRIEGGALVYVVKHAGEHHTVRIDLAWLEKVLTATAG